MLAQIIRRNNLHPEDVASATFTTTVDLNVVYPAEAARQLGWLDVPLICGHEMQVPNGLPRCIRVLIHWNTRRSQKEVVHVYVGEAESLRPDRTQFEPSRSSQANPTDSEPQRTGAK
jgi:chorismate mutase